MKKISTIFLLIVIFIFQVANSIIYQVIHSFEKQKMEAYILSTIPESECEFFKLDSIQHYIKWEKHGEIFTLNGELFDVSKTKIIDGSVYLFCIKEKREMEILQDLTVKISSGDYSGKPLHLTPGQDCIIPEIQQQQNETSISEPLLKIQPFLPDYIRNILLPPPRPGDI